MRQKSNELRNVVIPDDPRALLDEHQAAKVLGVSVHKMRRDRWAGGGVLFVKMSGAVRYSIEAINEYILSRTRSLLPTPAAIMRPKRREPLTGGNRRGTKEETEMILGKITPA